MAAENIRGDTPKQSPPVVENEQFSDIILILDKMELLLQAVTKLDKNGRYESVPAKEENRNSFLKLDRYANINRKSDRPSKTSPRERRPTRWRSSSRSTTSRRKAKNRVSTIKMTKKWQSKNKPPGRRPHRTVSPSTGSTNR